MYRDMQNNLNKSFSSNSSMIDMNLTFFLSTAWYSLDIVRNTNKNEWIRWNGVREEEEEEEKKSLSMTDTDTHLTSNSSL
jgi:hypothetical protein